MDTELQDAIKAHVEWVVMIADRIGEGKLAEADIPNIRKDDQCKIGLWLKSLEDECRSLPEYQKLCSVHAAFHSQAASILEECLGGNREKAIHWMLRQGGAEGVAHDLISAFVAFLFRRDQIAVEKRRSDGNREIELKKSEVAANFHGN